MKNVNQRSSSDDSQQIGWRLCHESAFGKTQSNATISLHSRIFGLHVTSQSVVLITMLPTTFYTLILVPCLFLSCTEVLSLATSFTCVEDAQVTNTESVTPVISKERLYTRHPPLGSHGRSFTPLILGPPRPPPPPPPPPLLPPQRPPPPRPLPLDPLEFRVTRTNREYAANAISNAIATDIVGSIVRSGSNKGENTQCALD